MDAVYHIHMLKRTNVANKEKDKEAYELYKEYGSVRKAAEHSNVGKTMLHRRKKRWEQHLDGKQGYPEL